MQGEPEQPREGEEQALERLRGLLRERVSPEDVGDVLPEAIAKREKKDDLLARTLTPTIEGAIESSVKRNPRVLTDAIFPLMGPAIRKSISQTLASLVEGLNRTLEHSMSPRGIRWRLEAWRTGMPFAEVVLRHSVAYRVEQVLFIHRETALLVEHVTAPSVVPAEGDVVSSMLGAIQDFVSDSFGGEGSSEGAGVQQVEFGDQTLDVATGPSAVLAFVVRGVVPAEVRVRFQEALESIHAQWSKELAAFDGDPTPLLPARAQLEELLVEKRREQRGGSRVRSGSLVLGVAALVILALLVLNYVGDHRRAERWRVALEALDRAPGLVVTNTSERDDVLWVEGLRDPLADEAAAVLERAEVDEDELRHTWRPFQSLDPEIVLARAKRVLDPPPTVEVALAGGRLEVRGSAPHAWITRSRVLAPALPGVDAWDADVADEDLAHARTLAAEADDVFVPFAHASSELAPHAMAALESRLAPLDAAAAAAEVRIAVRMGGRVATSEPAELARDRCAAVAAWLHASLRSDLRIESDAAVASGDELRGVDLVLELDER